VIVIGTPLPRQVIVIWRGSLHRVWTERPAHVVRGQAARGPHVLKHMRELDDEPDDARPIWHASGWSPVFAEGEPGTPRARLIGHTRFVLDHIHNGHRIRTFMLGPSRADVGPPSSFTMHSPMVMYPYSRAGVLIWAWHLERSRDQDLIPEFRPMLKERHHQQEQP
jgi:hypothetical protein